MNFEKAIARITEKINDLARHPVSVVLKKTKKRYIGIVINSTVVYLFIYFLVLLLYQAATVIASITFNIHLICFYNRIFFMTSGKSTVWNQDSILTVFSSAPAVMIYFCAICIVIFITKYNKESRYKLLFVWGYTLILNRIISVFAIGLIFTLWGSNLIVDWLYFDTSAKIIFCAFSIIILLLVGKFSAKSFLYTAETPLLVKTDAKKLAFLISQALVPAIIGNIILFILLLPYINFLEVAVALSSVLMIIPVFFNYKKFKVIEAISILGNDIRDKQYNINKDNILILIVFYIIYRLVFIKGIFI
jgi:hypothetical protein